jgi:hypothetical protein
MEIMPLDVKRKTVEEVEQNDKTILKMKYGVIRISGEDYLREVSWETYNYLKNLPADFTGLVEIEELGLTVPVSQIVKLEEKEAESVRYKDFTKLPTAMLLLDKDFNHLTGTRPQIERENDIYYIATCHYVIRDGEKQYYLEPYQIQYLVTMVRDEDPDYPHYVKQSLHYGRDVREIQKEQAEKKRR